ncbi:MAG: AAA family ATPase, partial [Candidatus Peribacteraceae bacterium]|nr:AAA family ATPase [Candidatus Peribacteraceae bacterium]
MSDTELWEFRYSPKTFDEIILDDSIKPILSDAITNIPNMTIAGPPGCGKGTFMDVFTRTSDLEIFRLNGSDTNGINDIRDSVKPFAEAAGFDGTLKLVYINEADRLTLQAQDMLRDLIEKVQDITRFVLLCNYPERLTKELLSRCPLLVYPDPPIKSIVLKCIDILKNENVEYNNVDVINLVKSTYPDIRHTINMLKFNVNGGKLSSNLNIVSINEVYQEVLDAMKSGDPSIVRKVLRSNPIDYIKLYTFLYDRLMDSPDNNIFKNDFVAITEITEGAYRNDVVA